MRFRTRLVLRARRLARRVTARIRSSRCWLLVKQCAWLGLLGGLLLGCILQSEYLLLPVWLEEAGRLVYRGACLIIAPARLLVTLAIPRVNNHWPASHYVVACLITPYLMWGGYRLWQRFSRRVARHTLRCNNSPSQKVIERRQFLFRSAAGAVGIATSGIGSYASFVAPTRLRVCEYHVPIRNLPDPLDGIRLVHVSDTHYGPFVSLAFLEDVVQQANELEGDLVILTGDYVHFTPLSIERGVGLLGGFRSRFGSVAVLGNHEHWEGAESCRRVLARIGVPLLDNTRLFLTPKGLSPIPSPGRSLCLAGVGDLWEDKVLLDQSFEGVPDSMPRILLSHNPDVAELVGPSRRVDLMLSGHTHGGQVRLPILGALATASEYGEKYAGGLCDGPYCPVLVSRGIGMAFLPLRFGVPPELGLITLHRPGRTLFV